MRYINWVFRVVVFIVLLGFALKNDQPVTLRYFFGYEWQSSLIVVLLIFFAAGAAIGGQLLGRRVLAGRAHDDVAHSVGLSRGCQGTGLQCRQSADLSTR